MNRQHLNEHDANQGAQSSGEFLGMTGNSAWYLLGAGGATIMMVVFFWGVLGASLLFCLMVGSVLCLGAVSYVFVLKNNRPAHYDTDYFESALVEAGIVAFRFGPRTRPPTNPFRLIERGTVLDSHSVSKEPVQRTKGIGRRHGTASAGTSSARVSLPDGTAEQTGKRPGGASHDEQVVARSEYDRMQDKLAQTEAALEEALAEVGEDGP